MTVVVVYEVHLVKFITGGLYSSGDIVETTNKHGCCSGWHDRLVVIIMQQMQYARIC